MTLPLLAVEAHRAIDRRDALVALLDGDQPQRFQVTADVQLDRARAFLEECRRVFMALRHVRSGQ